MHEEEKINKTLRVLGEKIMKKIFDIVTRRHLIFLIISIIYALPFISFTPFVKTVDNVDYFTLKNDRDVEFYDELRALRTDFFDRITGIYMISLFFLYPDHPVYPVKKIIGV